MSERLKPIEFRGSTLNGLRAFPHAARQEAGHQLHRVQEGLDPDELEAYGYGRAGRSRDTHTGRGMAHFGCFMSLGSRKPFTCCTAFRKGRRKRAEAISILLPSATRNC